MASNSSEFLTLGNGNMSRSVQVSFFAIQFDHRSRTWEMAMARKVVVEMADDIDGSVATQTLTFAVRGVDYEIDLSEKNAKKFEDALAPYVGHGRRVGGRRGRTPGKGGGVPSGIDPKAVRAWAVEEGIAISARGRIPHQLVEQYQAAAR
jgi:hypothetical protein